MTVKYQFFYLFKKCVSIVFHSRVTFHRVPYSNMELVNPATARKSWSVRLFPMLTQDCDNSGGSTQSTVCSREET